MNALHLSDDFGPVAYGPAQFRADHSRPFEGFQQFVTVHPRLMFAAIQTALMQVGGIALSNDSHAGQVVTGTMTDHLTGHEYEVIVRPKVQP